MDKPRDEIEITDDMVEAGTKALELWDSGDLPEWKVISVYKAMERARKDATAAPTRSPGFLAEAEKVRR
jgi:hypothetical protein